MTDKPITSEAVLFMHQIFPDANMVSIRADGWWGAVFGEGHECSAFVRLGDASYITFGPSMQEAIEKLRVRVEKEHKPSKELEEIARENTRDQIEWLKINNRVRDLERENAELRAMLPHNTGEE